MKKKVIIIAEAGVNHNGTLEYAYNLIEEASRAGADYVKFQTFKTESCISKNTSLAEYQQKQNTGARDQIELLRQLELTQDMHFKLINHCRKCNIRFISTGFDLPSLKFLESLDMDFFKIPSGEITNYPYLKAISRINKPVILSTGMASLKEIKTAIQLIDKEKLTILHCNTEYPTPMRDVNLNAMVTIRKEFETPVGYSDHTLGIEIPIAAVAMGAVVIEKHLTLNRKMSGPDHKASLEPAEFCAMVSAIRNVETALGSGIKEPSKSELKNLSIARKSIVASICIRKGETFCENNITVKRPGNGINPMKWEMIIGMKANRDYLEDELIEL